MWSVLTNSCFSESAFREVKELTSDFLKDTGLVGYEFARVFDSGKAIVLYSNPALAKYVFKNQVHIASPVPEQVIKPSFWYLPTPETVYSRKLVEIESIAGAKSFSNFVERQPGYFDFNCFLSQSPQCFANSHFMNQKDHLEIFGKHFKRRARKLISASFEIPFQVPDKMMPNFKGLSRYEIGMFESDFPLQFEKFRFELRRMVKPRGGKARSFYLTERESESVMALIRGKTIPEIAQEQGLSPRTIEQHFDAVKSKLGCNKKSEIIDKMIGIYRERCEF